ncbi:26S proteasome non-ATPase regulatory subunit 6-like isoform X2 [Cylas formicarius]|uniref:26S proteasome non-ATPase regulatory subunit 6-like isoform X2 n=1 Tax=Cylas formicarius TaxID=197179 RepID=UPI0029587AE1|nr:26S proteasome non-ATPase regulatory subunit 6-like isoform X2 [Cylas formicarius]
MSPDKKMDPLNTDSEAVIFYDISCTNVNEPSLKRQTECRKNPNLDIAQLKFLLTLTEHKNDTEYSNKLLRHIEENDMAPFYELVCKELDWEINRELFDRMKESNAKRLDLLDAEIEFARGNLGAIEVKEAYLDKANYLSSIGDKDETIKMLSQAYANTVALGCQLDNVFHRIRLGLFFNDSELIKKNLSRCNELIEKGADWHHRNCHKIYKGLFSLTVRDFMTASNAFVSSISTFVCTEITSYEEFIRYTILTSMLTLKRQDLYGKILTNPEIAWQK